MTTAERNELIPTKIFRRFTAEDYEAFRPDVKVKCQSLPAETGTAVRHVAADLCESVAFIGVMFMGVTSTDNGLAIHGKTRIF